MLYNIDCLPASTHLSYRLDYDGNWSLTAKECIESKCMVPFILGLIDYTMRNKPGATFFWVHNLDPDTQRYLYWSAHYEPELQEKIYSVMTVDKEGDYDPYNNALATARDYLTGKANGRAEATIQHIYECAKIAYNIH